MDHKRVKRWRNWDEQKKQRIYSLTFFFLLFLMMINDALSLKVMPPDKIIASQQPMDEIKMEKA